MTRAKKKRHPIRAATRHARAKAIGIALMGGYAAQLAKQGGSCAICGTRPKTRRLNIDHEHQGQAGAVRGLLCPRCNRGLGWFRDRPDLLETAAIYLKWGWSAAVAYRDARWQRAEEEQHGSPAKSV